MNKIIDANIKTVITLFIVMMFPIINANPKILGDWYGELSVGEIKLPIVFHITSKDGILLSTMDSPSQGAKGIPISETSFVNEQLIINAPNLGIRYEGTLSEEGQIKGVFKQSGQSFDMNMSHNAPVKITKKQIPKPPFTYREEMVTVSNKQAGNKQAGNKQAGIQLKGTFTFPQSKKASTAVILISGSGPKIETVKS